MEATAIAALSAVLPVLEKLDDEELRAVIGRAQGLLLDRPNPRSLAPALSVEVVGREESQLLALYRTLGPRAQRRLVSNAQRLARAPRRLVPRPRIALTAPRTVAASLLPRPRRGVTP